MTLAVWLAYTLTELFVPAGTIVALALTRPSGEFNVDVYGRVKPAGHTVIYPRDPLSGTAVTFRENAAAEGGIPQLPLGIAKSRELCP